MTWIRQISLRSITLIYETVFNSPVLLRSGPCSGDHVMERCSFPDFLDFATHKVSTVVVVVLQGRHVGLEREFHGIVIDNAHGIAIVGRVE
jgi:hypothetical protein